MLEKAWAMFIKKKSLLILYFNPALKLNVFWWKEMSFVGWALYRTVANDGYVRLGAPCMNPS